MDKDGFDKNMKNHNIVLTYHTQPQRHNYIINHTLIKKSFYIISERAKDTAESKHIDELRLVEIY